MLKKNKNDNLWNAWLYVLASPEVARRYRCKITVRNVGFTRSITYVGKVHSLDRNVSDILENNDCLVFTDGFVRYLR